MFKFLKEKISNAVSKVASIIKGKAKEEEKKAEEEEKKVEKEIEKIEHEIKELPKKEAEKKEEIVEEKKSIIKRIKEKLETTKISEQDFDNLFGQFENVLIENNVAIAVLDKIKEKLKKELFEKEIKKKEIEVRIKESLREAISSLLLKPFDLVEETKKAKPFVIVFFGINGSGKTTTIAKVANLFLKHNKKCVLAASDTFRAASIEQLEKHANVLNIEVIKHKYGADPAAVAFDAIAHAKARNIDVVLIDTAGRMHTKTDLMKEMEKICRVAKPNLKIFVGEAITGNDAVEQAKSFNDLIEIDAIILTKADVDEKGGACISVSHVTGKPILFLGTGQRYDDLQIFEPEKIIKSLGL